MPEILDNAELTLSIGCKRCQSALIVTQPIPTNKSFIAIAPCQSCIKDLALEVIRNKKQEFDATYDAVETLINELNLNAIPTD